jgi:hypothetical protein
MRRLEGVMESSRLSDADDLKRYALFFDRVHLIKVSGLHSLYDLMHTVGLRDPRRTDAELDFLEKRGFISGIDERSYQGLITKVVNTSQFIEQAEHHDLFHEHMGFVNFSNIIAKHLSEEFGPQSLGETPEMRQKKPGASDHLSDSYVRITSLGLAIENSQIDLVPVCFGEPQNHMLTDDQRQIVWGVALDRFPTPGPTSAWEDILNFKSEMHDKQWHFRRFLHSLTTKRQTEAEIVDDIEWSLNEYTKAMELHHLKAGNSFMEVYVMPVIELAEDLAKFNWSKIAKGVLSVRKRHVELMEAEMKAPGRECAYVFEARKRFGTTLGNSDI